eukprot:11184321-Lingulodinium_polyedra.AAC.1
MLFKGGEFHVQGVGRDQRSWDTTAKTAFDRRAATLPPLCSCNAANKVCMALGSQGSSSAWGVAPMMLESLTFLRGLARGGGEPAEASGGPRALQDPLNESGMSASTSASARRNRRSRGSITNGCHRSRELSPRCRNRCPYGSSVIPKMCSA